MTEAITRAQDKGWVRQDLNPRAIAVFLQAYSLGRAVDDVAENHISNDDWVQLIGVMIGSLQSS